MKTAEKSGTVEIEAKLEQWNHLIREQEEEKASRFKEKLDSLILGIRNPLLETTYHLLQIRFYLLFKDTGRVLDGFSAVGSPRDLPNDRLKYYFYFFNGILLYDHKCYNEAMESFLMAEPFLKALEDPREIAEFKYKFSVVYHRANYLLLSIYMASDALKFFQKQNHLNRWADCENVLAVNTKYIEDYKRSEKHYWKAIKLVEKTGNRKRLGFYYKNLGILYSEQNLHESAISCLEKAYPFTAFGEHEGQDIKNIYLLAKEFFKTGQNHKAFRWLELGLRLSLETGDEEYDHHFQLLKAKYVPEDNDFEEVYKKAVHYFEEQKLWDYTIEYSEELATYLQEKEHHKEANRYYALAIQAKKIIQKKGALISWENSWQR